MAARDGRAYRLTGAGLLDGALALRWTGTCALCHQEFDLLLALDAPLARRHCDRHTTPDNP